MKDRNLLKQKLALIASNAVFSDSVVNALDDAVALLDEDAKEIDKLRRHNASLVANGIQASLSKDEIVTNTLKNARIKIEQAGQRGQKERYHVDGEYGDHGWLHYCKGVRDACWAIDDMISDLGNDCPDDIQF